MPPRTLAMLQVSDVKARYCRIHAFHGQAHRLFWKLPLLEIFIFRRISRDYCVNLVHLHFLLRGLLQEIPLWNRCEYFHIVTWVVSFEMCKTQLRIQVRNLVEMLHGSNIWFWTTRRRRNMVVQSAETVSSSSVNLTTWTLTVSTSSCHESTLSTISTTTLWESLPGSQ